MMSTLPIQTKRRWLATLLPICVLLFDIHADLSQQGSLPQHATVNFGTEIPPFQNRLELAVVNGSVGALKRLRSDLLVQIDTEKEDLSADDRYMLAYINWRICQLLEDDAKKERRRLLKEAQNELETLLENDPYDAEAYALRGTIVGELIGGFFGGMFLGSRANASLKRSYELDPSNPRVALQRGVGFFFTPKSFGGGLVKAECELKRARELFLHEQPDKPWPNWGRIDILGWLGKVLAERGNVDEARVLYNEALILEPSHRWIRNELLPALEPGASKW